MWLSGLNLESLDSEVAPTLTSDLGKTTFRCSHAKSSHAKSRFV